MSMSPFIEMSSILAIAGVIALCMQWLRLPLILGHIITGIITGPALLNIIQSQETLHIFSQLGISALLFIVGIGLSPHILREVGKVAVYTGLGQIIFTTLFGFIIAILFGFSAITSLFIAVALTFSSTIIIMKLLSDRGDLEKLYGKISIGFLLVQDLAATIILVLVSSFANGSNIGLATLLLILKLIVVISISVLIATHILPKLTRLFAASQEFLFLFTVAWGMGMSAIFYFFGISIEIGALVAGITLASSTYRFEIAAKMSLIRDFFLIMFFVLLGSELSWSNVSAYWVETLVFSAFILIGNPLIVMAIMGILGYNKKTSFFAGLTVAQISEFSLVLILLGVNKGILDTGVLSLVTIVGIVTIVSSSLMILNADTLFNIFSPILSIFERKRTISDRKKKEVVDAILIGCHRMGHDFIRTLKKLDLSFIVVDFDPAVIINLSEKNIPCRYGDAHDNEFWQEFDLSSVKLIITTTPDHDTNMFVLTKVRKVNKKAIIIANAKNIDAANDLYQKGADYVVAPQYLGGNHTAMLLEELGINKQKFTKEKAHHIKHLERRSRLES